MDGSQAQVLSGQRVDVIHIVGVGTQNKLLCQPTANASGLPVEATARGNVLVQARAAGAATASVAQLRAMVAASHPGTKYAPRR